MNATLKIALSLTLGFGSAMTSADTETHKDHCARRAQSYVRSEEHLIAQGRNAGGAHDYTVEELSSKRMKKGPLTPQGSVDVYVVEAVLEDDTDSYRVIYRLAMQRHVGGRSCRVQEALERIEFSRE